MHPQKKKGTDWGAELGLFPLFLSGLFLRCPMTHFPMLYFSLLHLPTYPLRQEVAGCTWQPPSSSESWCHHFLSQDEFWNACQSLSIICTSNHPCAYTPSAFDGDEEGWTRSDLPTAFPPCTKWSNLVLFFCIEIRKSLLCKVCLTFQSRDCVSLSAFTPGKRRKLNLERRELELVGISFTRHEDGIIDL